MIEDVETRARRLGWFPETEWDPRRASAQGRKKPTRFLTAAEFIARVENELPVLRSHLARLEEKCAKHERSIEDLNDLVLMLHERHKRAMERLRGASAGAPKEADARPPLSVEDLPEEDRADCALFCQLIPGCTPADYASLYARR